MCILDTSCQSRFTYCWAGDHSRNAEKTCLKADELTSRDFKFFGGIKDKTLYLNKVDPTFICKDNAKHFSCWAVVVQCGVSSELSEE